MSTVRTRTFELMSSVSFHGLPAEHLDSFVTALGQAMGAVLPDYPSVVAFLLEVDPSTGDVNYGLRFSVVDPAYVEDMASEILERAVERAGEVAGREPLEAEREESVLVLTQ